MNVVIIGAGASGLCCAINLARRGIDVTILDRLSSCGKKILVTGNGRCNYWNEDFTNKHFYSDDFENLNIINSVKNKNEVLTFFSSLGIVPTIKNGYYYPMSMQASSIRDILLLEAKTYGVKFINDFNVKCVKKMNNKFFVISDSGEVICDKLVVACGSYSYYNEKTLGYEICKSFNHSINPVLPSLVQLVGNDSFYKDWDGVRSNATVKLYVDEHLEKEDSGEIMLTNYGVSGICIFNLSGVANRAIYNGKKVKININFLPNIVDLFEFFEERSKLIDFDLYNFLVGLLNNKLVNLILKRCDLNNNKKWNDLNTIEKRNLVDMISSFDVNIISSKSFDNSQVCTGGVSLKEINPNTMESLKCNNLYIIGEVLDVDGECGGYNLGFAWITGLIAGRSVNND